MKKFLRLVVHNHKKIEKVLLIAAVAYIAYDLAHTYGTMQRGYEAIGGEIFIPFLIIFAKKIWGKIIKPFEVA